MVNKKRFDWAVGVLVKAYLNGTLQRQKCTCCAVGNLVCDSMGYELKRTDRGIYWSNGINTLIPSWDYIHAVINKESGAYQVFNRGRKDDIEDGKKEIAATGYTPEETAKIEWAFETGGPDMFSGLMCVVDCLIEIHSGTESDRVEAKQLFETKI